MKYTILEGVSQCDSCSAVSDLEDQVQEYLDLGWRLCGGVNIAHIITKEKRLSSGECFTVLQALTHDGDGPLPGEA